MQGPSDDRSAVGMGHIQDHLLPGQAEPAGQVTAELIRKIARNAQQIHGHDDAHPSQAVLQSQGLRPDILPDTLGRMVPESISRHPDRLPRGDADTRTARLPAGPGLERQRG